MNSDFTLAVHSLTLLSLLPDRMSTSDAIAESACVHPVRIRKVLGLLKKQGFIQSREGTGGGFVFTKEPSEVSLWDLYQLTANGTIQPKCPKSNHECIVGSNMKHVLTSIFEDGEEYLGSFLNQYTIQDIVKQVKQES
ncbi:RrF2 family transcriptional regulator [Bacillus dakarensis]|uniref:RrF2 family transcriptional regulator n=1 Tax=Robertmurraya dakarensis TaxID=1926278 RepID=UPI00098264AB|nr:Rrf2 family transcriptional regulator [Bacillus dakarensis]